MKALGMIEVYGYLPAVEALDSALKAANVKLVDVTLVEGGLVTVMITGDVGAVKAAVDAANTAALRVGKVISVHVIPRPSQELEKIVSFRIPDYLPEFLEMEDMNSESPNIKIIHEEDLVQPEIIHEEDIVEPETIHQDEVIWSDHREEELTQEPVIDYLDYSQITEEAMQSMTVDRLRRLAREIEITNMTRKEIRFATKHELIDSISKFIEEERA